MKNGADGSGSFEIRGGDPHPIKNTQRGAPTSLVCIILCIYYYTPGGVVHFGRALRDQPKCTKWCMDLQEDIKMSQELLSWRVALPEQDIVLQR